MSRAYRIRVSESIERVVHVEDGVATTLELLPILARERMGALLEEELERRGFESDGASAKRNEGDGVEVVVDLASGSVTVRVASEKEVKVEAERSGAVGHPDQVATGTEKLREQTLAVLEERVHAEAEALRRDATSRLERKLRDLRREIDETSNRVTAEALKERAAQLGEIEELSEDPESGELVIKVRV